MPGKLYPDSLAAAIVKARAANPDDAEAKLYRPSNGTDGEEFEARWCRLCKREGMYERGQAEPCEIMGNAFFHDVEDPGYPREWTHDAEGQPCCTAFEPDDNQGPMPKLDDLEFFGKPATESEGLR